MARSTDFLFLTGYRGCGKSTIGSKVAAELKLPLLDTDKEIEKVQGESISTIFEQRGESAFRDLETQCIRSLANAGRRMVVSLGGGAIIRDENRSAIRALGLTVWLQASPETLHKRICDDVATAAQRPKLSKLGDLEEIRTILARREAWYDEVADLRISTESLTLDEVTAQIAAWFRGHT